MVTHELLRYYISLLYSDLLSNIFVCALKERGTLSPKSAKMGHKAVLPSSKSTLGRLAGLASSTSTNNACESRQCHCGPRVEHAAWLAEVRAIEPSAHVWCAPRQELVRLRDR